MPTEKKQNIVASLTDKLSRMQFAVVADYRGMTVSQITDLRRKLDESNAEVVVAKNTLLRIAAREAGREEIESLLVGPTAVLFAYDDVAATAKALNDYARSSPNLFNVRGGVLGTSLIQPEGLEDVAKMPSRQEILGQVVGTIQSPMAGVVGCINAPVADVVGCVNSVVSDVLNVLQARVTQLEGAAA